MLEALAAEPRHDQSAPAAPAGFVGRAPLASIVIWPSKTSFPL
jgi:hypothetical protein